MFTKKHMIVIAKILSEEPNHVARLDLAQKFAEVLEDDNPLFDREKFLTACNIKE